MEMLYCNGCRTALHDFAEEIRCPHCGLLNGRKNGQTEILFDKDKINKNTKLKTLRVADDLSDYLTVLKQVTGMDYTEILNRGIVEFINRLPNEIKEKIAKQIDLNNEGK